MKVVWKFNVPNYSGEMLLTLPRGSQILTVQLQGETPHLWALVDSEEINAETVKVFTRETGDVSIPIGAQYVATVNNGYRTLHYFYLLEEKQL